MFNPIDSAKGTLSNFPNDDIMLIEISNSTNDKIFAVDAKPTSQRNNLELLILQRIFIRRLGAARPLRFWH